MVFIHGGYFLFGASSETWANGTFMYDGQYLAEHGPAVVVTLNYRLGALGFLAHSALAEESPQHTTGNYGLLDQIAALSWVQRNISGFGGDPKRVMVFGESAGAESTCALVTSPLAAGLFSRALAESGDFCRARSLTDAENVGDTVTEAVGCKNAPDVAACLRAATANTIAAAVPPIPKNGKNLFVPNIDGYVLQQSPIAAMRAGMHADVAFAVGTNANEYSLFYSVFFGTTPVGTDSDYQGLVRQVFGVSFGDRVVAAYPSDHFATPKDAFVQVMTDYAETCPARRIAGAMASTQKGQVWRYFYTHGFESGPQKPLGAGHFVEIPFVFHNLTLPNYSPSPAELALSDAMVGYWTRFAATGDPNGGGAVAWPGYVTSADPAVVLDEKVTSVAGVRTPLCDLWDTLPGTP
jgi:para-nitrobenzyl esterase